MGCSKKGLREGGIAPPRAKDENFGCTVKEADGDPGYAVHSLWDPG